MIHLRFLDLHQHKHGIDTSLRHVVPAVLLVFFVCMSSCRVQFVSSASIVSTLRKRNQSNTISNKLNPSNIYARNKTATSSIDRCIEQFQPAMLGGGDMNMDGVVDRLEYLGILASLARQENGCSDNQVRLTNAIDRIFANYEDVACLCEHFSIEATDMIGTSSLSSLISSSLPSSRNDKCCAGNPSVIPYQRYNDSQYVFAMCFRVVKALSVHCLSSFSTLSPSIIPSSEKTKHQKAYNGDGISNTTQNSTSTPMVSTMLIDESQKSRSESNTNQYDRDRNLYIYVVISLIGIFVSVFAFSLITLLIQKKHIQADKLEHFIDSIQTENQYSENSSSEQDEGSDDDNDDMSKSVVSSSSEIIRNLQESKPTIYHKIHQKILASIFVIRRSSTTHNNFDKQNNSKKVYSSNKDVHDFQSPADKYNNFNARHLETMDATSIGEDPLYSIYSKVDGNGLEVIAIKSNSFEDGVSKGNCAHSFNQEIKDCQHPMRCDFETSSSMFCEKQLSRMDRTGGYAHRPKLPSSSLSEIEDSDISNEAWIEFELQCSSHADDDCVAIRVPDFNDSFLSPKIAANIRCRQNLSVPNSFTHAGNEKSIVSIDRHNRLIASSIDVSLLYLPKDMIPIRKQKNRNSARQETKSSSAVVSPGLLPCQVFHATLSASQIEL